MNNSFDFIVLGGGILGMATARTLQGRYPDASIVVLEKESALASHQTGRNSGVIHAGVYYKPGSLKADFCKRGNIATKAFCDEFGVEYKVPGKLLVATSDLEEERMEGLIDRCEQNGIAHERVDQAGLRELEPNIAGQAAIYVPSSGIVNYAHIVQRMAEQFSAAGGIVRLSTQVTQVQTSAQHVEVNTTQGKLKGGFLVSCGGLMSDRLVAMLGEKPSFKIIPFRGEYFKLPEQKQSLVTRMIYPIPDPQFPFLGVHLTPMVNGDLTVGPNAVLAMGREAYQKTDVNLGDMLEMAGYSGMRAILKRHFKTSVMELKNSLYRPGYLKLVQKYCPQLSLADLKSYPSGIRAQAVYPNGDLVDDFLFVEAPRALVVANAPSPAATSAIPISEHIVDRVAAML